MPRRAGQAVGGGGLVYQVMNRGNLRAAIFHKDGDDETFERILQEAWQRTPVEQRQLLSPWPVTQPADWLEAVNRSMRASEQEAIRQGVKRGRPREKD